MINDVFLKADTEPHPMKALEEIKARPSLAPNATFDRPGVSDVFLSQAGCHHVGEDESIELYGCRAEGIAIPFHSLDGGNILASEKTFARIRLYAPTESQKYHQRSGVGTHIYIPHNFRDLPRGATLILTEGEFKALALAEAGFASVGLCGICGAMTAAKLHVELVEILEFHKPAHVIFLGDSDTVLNSDFARETSKLRKALFGSNRFPFVNELRAAVCPLSGSRGVDDVRRAMGEEFNPWFSDLVANAFVVPPKATPTEIFCGLLRRETDSVMKSIGSDDSDAHRNKVKLLQSAKHLQRETGALLLIKPLLGRLFKKREQQIGGLLRNAGDSQPIIEIDDQSDLDIPVLNQPWPECVNGAELLTEIAETYTKFSVLPSHAADVLAVWVLMTYCYEQFGFAAIIAVWSPEPSCGKGRVLDVTEKVARGAFRTANTSAAVLYHSVAKGGITVLIDELDSQSEDQRHAISNILKSGFQSNGKAHRMAEVDGVQTVVEFSTYSPKMVATIGLDTIDKASRTRSIGIQMQRKKRSDKIAKFRRYDGTEIQRKCERWAVDNGEKLASMEPMEINECKTDREEDVWEPLAAIARLAGGDWEARIRDAARSLSGGSTASASEGIGHQILTAFRDYFDANGPEVDTKTVAEHFNATGEFTDLNRGRGATAAFLARHLRPYGISSTNIRLGVKVAKGYRRGDFDEAFLTYIISAAPVPDVSRRYNATSADSIDQKSLFESATEPKCSGTENAVPTNDASACSVVAESNASGEEEDVL